MKRDIYIFHYSMVFGGVEKMLIDIISNIDLTAFNVSLILFRGEGELLDKLPKGINVQIMYTPIKKKRNFFGIFYKLLSLILFTVNIFIWRLKLAKEIHKETLLVVMNIRFLLINMFVFSFSSRVIGWFHSHVICDKKTLFVLLNYKLFTKFDEIITVSKDCEIGLKEKFSSLKDKVSVIYNPIRIEKIQELSKQSIPYKDDFILSVGRFSNQKGFDILVKSYAKCLKLGMKEKLVIIGDGPLYEEVSLLIKKLGIEESCLLFGFDENPYRWMSKAKLFVLSSRYEGFGIVLAEAMACELPCVAFDCYSGPREVLLNGKCGMLVESGNEQKLSEAMLELCNDSVEQQKFKIEGLKRIVDFSIDNYMLVLEKKLL